MPEPLFKAGDKCPCAACSGHFAQEGEDYVECPVCGYCPEDEFDGRIVNCPSCQSWAHVINQGNIVCSGCSLELTESTEELALAKWNALGRVA